MNLTEYIENNPVLTKLSSTGATFTALYPFWLNNLFERTMRLFVWKSEGVAQKHIEMPVLAGGSCFITDKYHGKLTAFAGNWSGSPTVYYDEFKQYSVHSPLYSAVLNVGSDGIVIKNNSLMNSVYPLCHRYAMLLAHADVTFVDELVELRNQNGAAKVSTEAAKQSYQTYRNNLCNGKVLPMVDPAFSTIEITGATHRNGGTLKELVEVQQNILNSFYADLGVKTSWNKKGNMIAEEVEGNDSMLLLNISDMLEARQEACEEINKRFGVNWSVDLAEELKYDEASEEDPNEQSNNS